MPRQANAGDFSVDVDGIGTFTFGRRTARDAFRIRGDYAQLTGSNYDANGFAADIGALAFASINVLMVTAPTGFDLAKLDPLASEDWEGPVVEVFSRLRDKELSFRPGAGEASAAAGA